MLMVQDVFVILQVQDLSSPVANLEYKAFHNLPHNDEFKALIPDSR